MAPSALKYPQVNGAKYSFCSLEFKLAGGFALPGGVKTINYKDNYESGDVFGNSATLQGSTRGRNKSSGDIELYRDAAEALLDYITFLGARGYSETRFTFTVGYGELLANMITSDILPSVKFHSMDTSGSEGVEAITVKYQMHMLGQIGWHGRTGPKYALSESPVITAL
jgi:hypothetical protein